MSTLWGSKKTDNADDDEDNTLHVNGNGSGEAADNSNMARSSDERPRSQRSRREPTERDRLLPNNPRPPHSDGYLDPDDPAVSAHHPLPYREECNAD